MAQILLAGASGFLGSNLRAALVAQGHDVTALVRRAPESEHESRWDPYAGSLDRAAVVESADVVVNLAGSPTAGNPHSATWARELRDSRVTTTRVLAEAIAASERRPAFLAGNGISYYGDRSGSSDQPEAVLDEHADSRGEALLTSVTREWQAVAESAADAGARLCVLRTAPVMDRRSEPLRLLRRLYLAGLGGKLGDGRQRMPMISLRDWVGAVVHLAEHEDAAGPFNLCCPRTPTNGEFTEALAGQLHRPSVARVPKAVLRIAAGRMAPELLGSLNVVPAALQSSGYEFQDPDVTAVVRAGLSEAS